MVLVYLSQQVPRLSQISRSALVIQKSRCDTTTVGLVVQLNNTPHTVRGVPGDHVNNATWQ